MSSPSLRCRDNRPIVVVEGPVGRLASLIGALRQLPPSHVRVRASVRACVRARVCGGLRAHSADVCVCVSVCVCVRARAHASRNDSLAQARPDMHRAALAHFVERRRKPSAWAVASSSCSSRLSSSSRSGPAPAPPPAAAERRRAATSSRVVQTMS
jgi:hypothetical protein